MATGFDVRATHRYLRISPQKVRLVLDQIRGEDALEAMHILKFANKAAAHPVLMLLRSAVANAEQNYGLNGAHLYIYRAYADDGPTRRWRRFGARLRFKPILRRQSHVTVILREHEGSLETVEG
ncbi:MAG: 50S ribosomal protein L22 [Anaerolineae bacterium]|nr:MAG: 50S ribosomal protein L22 [Anaerolineae bacterium]